MPGIHPASRKQVQWAFYAEKQGKLPRGTAREWAHNWKCWTWDAGARGGPLPKECKEAMQVLDEIRTKHPGWKVPAGVTAAAPSKLRVLRRPPSPEALPIAARVARVKAKAKPPNPPKLPKMPKTRTMTLGRARTWAASAPSTDWDTIVRDAVRRGIKKLR